MIRAMLLILSAVVVIGACCASPKSGEASLMVAPCGEIVDWGLQRADVVCAGTIESAPVRLVGSQYWRSAFTWIKDPEAFRVGFLVDSVIYGRASLVGSVLEVRYATWGPHVPDGAAPDFGRYVGKRRCLLYLVRQGAPRDAYEILDGRQLLLLGHKPENALWERLDAWQKLELEVASAVLEDEASVALAAIRSATAGHPQLGGPLVGALAARKSADDIRVSVEATAGLVRLGHKETLCALPQDLAHWRDGAPWALGVIGGSLEGVRDPDAVAALALLSQYEDPLIRRGALRALRYIRSDRAVAPLAKALGEADLRVRYDAVMGLAHQTGRMSSEWTCTFAQFQESPTELTDRWLRWWDEEGKSHYPALDETMPPLGGLPQALPPPPPAHQ